MRILIVDCETEVIENIERTIISIDREHKVTKADNTNDAVTFIQQYVFDLVLMRFEIPTVSEGMDLMRYIRRVKLEKSGSIGSKPRLWLFSEEVDNQMREFAKQMWAEEVFCQSDLADNLVNLNNQT